MIVADDMIADMPSNEQTSTNSSYLSDAGKESYFLFFLPIFFLAVAKDIRLNTTHYIFMISTKMRAWTNCN